MQPATSCPAVEMYKRRKVKMSRQIAARNRISLVSNSGVDAHSRDIFLQANNPFANLLTGSSNKGWPHRSLINERKGSFYHAGAKLDLIRHQHFNMIDQYSCIIWTKVFQFQCHRWVRSSTESCSLPLQTKKKKRFVLKGSLWCCNRRPQLQLHELTEQRLQVQRSITYKNDQ